MFPSVIQQYQIMESEIDVIINRSLEIFFRYGIKSVSMDDISCELGISKKTLYQYVVDKSDLVQKAMDLKTEQSMRSIDEIMQRGLNAIEELLEVNFLLNQLIDKHNPSVDYDLRKYYPEIYQQIIMGRRDRMLKMVQLNLEKGIREGLYRAGLKTELIAKMYISRVENLHSNESLLSNADFNCPAVFRELFEYHIRGISNPVGIAYLEKRLNEIEKSIIENNKTV